MSLPALRLRFRETLSSALILLGVVVLCGDAAGKPAAPPKGSFDQALAGAEPVWDLAALIDPLFDSCDRNAEPLSLRQCESARLFLEAQARRKTYVAVGDPAALDVSPYDASTKTVDFEIQGCLACLRPPKLPDGKGGETPRFVTTRAPRAIKAGHALGVDVGALQLEMSTPERQANWKKQEKRVSKRLRVQFVFTLGPTWTSGNFSGVSFAPVAYRILDACSGEVLAANPAPADGNLGKVSTPVMLAPGDTLTCPAPGQDISPEERAAQEALARLPARLSREDIEKGMIIVQQRVHDCHVEFEESGTVNLRLIIEGPSGKVKEAHVLPPFDKTPAGLCVRAAIRGATFARFRGDTQEVKLPVYLR